MAQTKTNGKDPAVLLYTQDFIVGTLTMTDEQRGKYILLLCYQHQKQNKLTLNDLQLAGGDEVILSKFPLQPDGYYYNDRMAMEIENRKVRTESSRKNGMLGGRPKTKDKPMGYDLDNLNETYNKPINNPTENENGSEDLNEDLIVNVNTNTGNLQNIVEKLLDVLVDYDSDIKDYNLAIDDYNELGGIDGVSEILGWDTTQKSNWNRKIQNVYELK
jgi:uncharacterized protein YdaU (DUF1376 family)